LPNKRQSKKDAKNALASFLGSFIPGINITPKVYYFGKKLEIKSKAKANNQTVEQYLEIDLKNKVSNIANLNEYDLASLAIDLNSYFKADKYFRKGWVVDGYWDAYYSCSEPIQLGLNAVSKW